jgi:carbamoyl-phosphate synthase small subunit
VEATLALEDGSVFSGIGFGASKDAVFELVFNTSMSGYQEIITDPSYRGQGILFTTSHIGNVGINLEDVESARPQAEAIVIRQYSPTYSSWRARQDLAGWMAENGVPGISQVDTRCLTRKLRDGGTQKAALSTRGTPAETLIQQARNWPGLDGRDMVAETSCQEAGEWKSDAGSCWVPDRRSPGEKTYRIVAFDFGMKLNILRNLNASGFEVIVVPASTPCETALAYHPDGIFLSNGPGDPAGLPGIVAQVKNLIDSGTPIFGICLGHQLIGRAIGGQTRRLKFGHHSGNHPVLDLRTRKVQITSQNHNYTLDPETVDPNTVEITHLSLNDGTVEGMRLKNRPVFSVQYHPEASPGPHDAQDLFSAFYELVSSQA